MEFIHSFLSKWVVPCIYLNPNMKNLKRKVEYLSATVDDLETELRLAEFHPAKRPRKEAQLWHKNARDKIESVSRLEEKVDRVGQWMFVSRILLGKEVEEKIQEVVELQERHNFPRGVLIDASPTFEQFMAAARFFRGSETVTTRNNGKYLMYDELSNVNHRRWQPRTSVNNQYLLPPPLNTCKVITTAVRPCPTSPDDGESNRSNKVGSEFIVDYSNEFVIHEIFKSRDELIRWVRDVGRRNGFVIVEKQLDTGGTHRKKPRLTLACEGSECYRDTRKNTRPKEKKLKLTGTKKCDCPFLLKAKKSDANDDWTLTVICGVHNHPAAVCLEGHSYAGRLSHEETSLSVDMLKSTVRPSENTFTMKTIYNAFQRQKVFEKALSHEETSLSVDMSKSMVRPSENAFTMKAIYNASQRQKVLEKAGRSEMQLLLGQLAVNKYIESHRNCKDTETVVDLFFAHPVSLDLLRAFPHVLLMDCTYKTNRYGLPLLEIVGVTSTEKTFSVGFAYLQYEREDNYAWALGILRSLMDENSLPNIIVTDRKLSLMNAIATIFPRATNLLCRWHINKNVLDKCEKLFEKKEKCDMFIASWNMLLMSFSEEVYMQRLALLQNEFNFYAEAFQYVTSSWLDAYKERFVAAWTDTYMHLGNLTMKRVGSLHAKLKRSLGSSQGSFQSNWSRIHNLLELQHIDIKSSFEKSKTIVPHKFESAQFKDLRGNVSIAALEMIWAEAKRASFVGIDIVTCGCVVRRTHGLPCAHEIADYMRENRPIPLTSIDQHWSRLDMLKNTKLDMFAEHYEEVNPTMQVQMSKKLREIQRPKVYPHQSTKRTNCSFVGEFPVHLPAARGWETAYSARMNDFTSLVGSSVVTTETIESDVDI